MSNNRPQDVADILEGMSTPTPNEVYEATREYDTNYIAAAAASKAHAGGGGGGSQPCTVSATEPASPAEGDLWLRILPNTDTYQLYAYHGSTWKAASAGVGADGSPFGDASARRVGGLVGDPDDDNFSGFESDTGWASSRMKSVDEDGNVNSVVEVRFDIAMLQYQSARLSADDTGWRLSGLPTIDPDVDGYLWIDPVDRTLKVSDGP